jgi:hypothetical protein
VDTQTVLDSANFEIVHSGDPTATIKIVATPEWLAAALKLPEDVWRKWWLESLSALEGDGEFDCDTSAFEEKVRDDPDFSMIVTLGNLKAQSADIETGRAKTTPWREVRAKADALHG